MSTQLEPDNSNDDTEPPPSEGTKRYAPMIGAIIGIAFTILTLGMSVSGIGGLGILLFLYPIPMLMEGNTLIMLSQYPTLGFLMGYVSRKGEQPLLLTILVTVLIQIVAIYCLYNFG